MIADTAESQKRKSDPVLLQLLGSGEPCSMALSHCVPKAGVRPEPVPIGFETGRRRKTVGQITLVFAILSFQGHVWDTVGQRDTGTKIGVRQSGALAYDITIVQAFSSSR